MFPLFQFLSEVNYRMLSASIVVDGFTSICCITWKKFGRYTFGRSIFKKFNFRALFVLFRKTIKKTTQTLELTELTPTKHESDINIICEHDSFTALSQFCRYTHSINEATSSGA